MKIFYRAVKILIEIAFFLSASYLMLLITYYFGWTLLLGRAPVGNDIASALSNAFYLEKWYPYIPQWSYLWAGGMPFLRLYPGAGIMITFFIHKLSNFTILQAGKLVMFASIFLTGVAVTFLGRVLTKSWWVGILAGILSLISADTWFWVTMGGFYAVATSVPVFAFAASFFILALEKKKATFYFLASFFYGLTWVFHPMAGMILSITLGVMTIFISIKNYGLRNSWKGLLTAFMIVVFGICLFAWWIVPFLRREDIGGIGTGAEQMYRDTLREMVGYDSPPGGYVTGTFFAPSAIILFLVGCVISFLRKNWVLIGAVFACGMALFIITAPSYAMPIVRIFQIIWASTTVRSTMVLRTLGMVVAAYGAISIGRPVFWLFEKLIKKLKGNRFWFYFSETVCAGLGFVIFWVIFKNVTILPLGTPEKNYPGYGPFNTWIVTGLENGKLSVKNTDTGVNEPFYKDVKTLIKEIPDIFKTVKQSSDSKLYGKDYLAEAVKAANLTEKDRIDIIPLKGELAGAINIYSGVTQISNYMGSSLIQPMTGWEIDCMYYSSLCGPEQIDDVARWFGISQIWLGEIEPPDFIARLNQSKMFKYSSLPLGKIYGTDMNLNRYLANEDISIASITNKPAILVIGGDPPNNDVYDIVFRGLSKVNFGYLNAWSIKGERFIDDYSLAELEKFEMIILHGYRYHNKQKAWDLLEKYVNGGGSLYADNGWQYYDQDWGSIVNGQHKEYVMPKVFPVTKTLWQNIEGGKWNLKIEDGEIGSGVTLNDWGQAIWSGQPWGVAGAQSGWLKKEARPILSNNGTVLMAAMNYGKGKIVWTGFDVWGHLTAYQADDERKIVQNSLNWLAPGKYQEVKLDYNRVTPDKIEVNFKTLSGKNKLMFKEVAGDNWGATLTIAGKLKGTEVYRAGPGWKFVFLPADSSGTVTFKYHRNINEWLGLTISILAFIFVLIYIGFRVGGKKIRFTFLEHFKEALVKKSYKIKTDWENEDK